ncbi:MAG: GDP-mannose 4,6-dehydratase [Desulfobia sp.]
MTEYNRVKEKLAASPRKWLVTGVAGFIGSNLLEALLSLDQQVVGLDNFATGFRDNLEQVRKQVSSRQWQRFTFLQGDIGDLDTCRRVCRGVDFILHQAALGSVPRSLEDPVRTHESNLSGFLNMLVAARDAGVDRFVYAASSSTYGDHPALPKVEDTIGRPLSPYAVTKYANELYAGVFGSAYGMKTVGLRYFNIFGRRQDPNGAYAAVMPRWFSALINGEDVFINGDGETSRDFCYIDNCIQANILAAVTGGQEALNQVYNVAFGEQTSLNELFYLIRRRVAEFKPEAGRVEPGYRDFRPGDVRHSLADISKARRLLGYEPLYSVADGLEQAARWYWENLNDNP